jgi:hypothetical protein
VASSTSLVILSLLSSLFLPLTAGCGNPSAGPGGPAIRFDACRAVALVLDVSATANQQTGARAAVDLWNSAAGTDLSMVQPSVQPIVQPSVAQPATQPLDASQTAPATLPVVFQAAAAPSHGLFDPTLGEVFINDDLVARPLAVTIAHEVGHAFGLVHVSNRPSVMNPGNLDIEPNSADVAALADLWGRCDGGLAAAAQSSAQSAQASD